MFEPIRELMTTSPDALVEDSALLGEQACQLFGGRDEAEFIARGGALYEPVALANVGVRGPSWPAVDDEDDNGSRVGGGTEREGHDGTGTDVVRRGSQHGRTWRHMGGGSNTPTWYTGERSRRRTSREPRSVLVVLLHRFFYFPFNVVLWVLTATAYVLPWLRAVFPFAVPASHTTSSALAAGAVFSSSTALTAAKGRSGPERVVAVAFHSNLPLLAAAVSEGGPSGRTRVVVYDVVEGQHLAALTHAFQRDVEALAWKRGAKDVLLVGCSGGVLVWHLTSAESPAQGQSRQRVGTGSGAARPTLSAGVDVEKTARCLFYACTRHVPVTALGLSCVDGRYVACGSRAHTYLYVLDLCASPASRDCVVSRRAITVDGGLTSVRFAEDDGFLIAAVHAHPSLALMRLGQQSDTSTVHVDTPAPVLQIVPLTGIPHLHYYALVTEGLEGTLIARVSPFAGVEVVSVLSTALFRGVGGSVQCLAASHGRLYLSVETGHTVVCRYGYRENKITVMPVGVAALPATQLCSFPGFTQGSLLAAVEREELVYFIPSYHT